MEIKILEWFAKYMPMIRNKNVLEVGSLNVNGSIKPLIKLFTSSYIGVDMKAGIGVDQVVDVLDIVKVFGSEKFDCVVCLETMEHVRFWREALHNLKAVLKPGGLLFFSAPGYGFTYHGYPDDFWRFSKLDGLRLFGDFETVALHYAFHEPRLYMIAKKPEHNFKEADLSAYPLYSIALGKISVAYPVISNKTKLKLAMKKMKMKRNMI